MHTSQYAKRPYCDNHPAEGAQRNDKCQVSNHKESNIWQFLIGKRLRWGLARYECAQLAHVGRCEPPHEEPRWWQVCAKRDAPSSARLARTRLWTDEDTHRKRMGNLCAGQDDVAG